MEKAEYDLQIVMVSFSIFILNELRTDFIFFMAKCG